MNSGDSTSGALVLFEPFLDHLRRQGFHIGVEHHLRLQRLLNRVAADCGPTELKTLLCPVFATNAEQQEFFYRTFDAYYPFFRATDPIDDGRSLPAGQSKEVPPPARVVRRWPYLAVATIALILSVAFLTWKTETVRRSVNPPSPAPSATTSAPTQPPPSPVPTPAPSPPKDETHSVRSRVTRIPPSVSRLLAWYSNQRIALGWTAVMGPLLSWLFYEVYRFRRRRLLIRKAQGKIPPYSWPIRTDLAPDIYPPYDLAVVSRLLHRRYQGEAQRLDVAATVEASIAALGFPTFRYRKDSRLPEYLFLIDRTSFRDHQARLHEHLAALLSGQGLYVSVYFYEGDPRVCWSSSGDESASLEQLQRAFPEYRLLLFGDGEQLLDAVTGRLAHWHRLLTAWPDRAVLTPEPPSEWGLREMTLATQFALAPATLDGLASLAAYFELPSSVDPRDWLEEVRSHGDLSGVADPLRRYLGEDTFQWLCACAIYPELQWDLTLCIGAVPSLPAGLVKEANLVKLLRLNWFRTGSMPDDLRRELIGQLDLKVQREVREAIIGLLESNPPPRDTFAASARQFQIAFQRLWANPKDRKARSELKAALENIPPDELAQDYAYLDAAESVSRSPLQLLLPSRLRKLVFPAGAPWLGMRSAVRLLLLAVAILGALSLLRLGDRRVTTEMNRYAAGLANGLGLSVAEIGDRVRVSWSRNTPALRRAQSGTLTIIDAGKVLQLHLRREELNAGSADYPPASSSLLFELAVADEAQNETIEKAGFQLTGPPAIASGPTSNEQPGGSVRIAGRVFHPPATAAIRQRAPGALEPPDPPGGTATISPITPFDQLLISTAVRPPPAPETTFHKETPVGVVVSANGAKLARENESRPVTAMAGDLLFSGDRLLTGTAIASFLFCPGKTIDTLSSFGEVHFDAKQVNVKTGKIAAQSARFCVFPPIMRIATGSQQHYGVTMTRPGGTGAGAGASPTPHNKLPADIVAELAPLDAALAANPKDQLALLAEAAIFENHKLVPNALEVYYKLREQWPDAVWIKGKIFELEEVLAAHVAAANAAGPGGKTYALIIGISKYANPGLSLQYAHADAQSMAQFLQSPRGGGVPAEQLLLLTDRDATTAAVRNGFQDFLKRRAGKTDTVFIFISAHGIVDGKDAFIVTYDSDPQDLKNTGLSMADLQSLFQEQVTQVGRVLLFVDVSKSGTIGSIKGKSVNADVANFKNVEGNLLAMMSARRNELSFEGPEFAGGHGAFTYYLLKGLNGAADENGDGVVDGEELASYVSNNVPKATNGRQHPTDISPGSINFKISDLKKPGINIS